MIQHLLVRGVETNPEIPVKPVGCMVNVWSVERLSEGSQVLSPQGHSCEAEASGGGRRPAGRLKDRRVPACICSFILRALTSACVWRAPVGVAKDGGAGASPRGWGILGSQDAPTSDHWVLSWGLERPRWAFLRVYMSGMEGHSVVCRETFRRDFARLSPDPFFLGTRGRWVTGGDCSRLVRRLGCHLQPQLSFQLS